MMMVIYLCFIPFIGSYSSIVLFGTAASVIATIISFGFSLFIVFDSMQPTHLLIFHKIYYELLAD